MADEDSMAYMDLNDVRDELNEETAVEELLDLLKFMQDELRERIEQHNQDVREAGPGETRDLLNQIEEFREKNEELQIEIDSLKSDGGGNKQRLEELEDQNRRHIEELQIKTREISDYKFQVESLESEKAELQRKLHEQESRARDKIREASKSGRGEREKGRELTQALEENRVLRIEIEELEHDRDTLIAALEEQHEEMTKAKQVADQAKTDYEDVQKNEDILKDDLKDARAKLLAAEDERHELEKVQASHETIVQRLQEEHELENREIKKALRNEKKLVAELQEENERMRDNTQVGALQKKLTKAENALKTQKEKNKHLQEQIEVGADELRRVAEKYIDLDDNFNEQLQGRVKAESRKIQQLEQIIKQEKERTELVRQQHEKTMEQLAEEQREKHELEVTTQLYEQGHGLEQAVAVQKQLKKDIKSLERTLIDKGRENEKISELNDVLEETCRRLKNELGFPRDFKYDDLEIRQGIQTEIQRLNGLNIMWQQQNKDLEFERLRLLKALRTQAQMHSSKGHNALGLNADQLLKLNEFAEQLKQGKDMEGIVVLDDKSQKLKIELDEVKVELRVAQKELDSLKAEHEEAQEHLQQAHEKGFVAAAVKYKPRRIVREERRAAEPESDSGPEAEESFSRSEEKSKRKMRKKKRKHDFDGTDDDSDSIVTKDGGLSEENMRMILDELKETRKDNEELQKLLKTQLKDDLKTEMAEITRNLASVVASQKPQQVVTKEIVVTKPEPKQNLQAQPSARTLESRRLANEQMNEMKQMERKLEEMMRLQAENAKSKTATDSETAKQHEEHTRELQMMITSATERNKMVTQKLQKEQQHAEEAQAEANAMRSKINQLERKLLRTENMLENAERDLAHQHANDTSNAQATTQQPGQTPLRVGFTPAIRQAAAIQQQQAAMNSSMMYSAPKSPSAKMMQQIQVASLQLPPEDWADELSSVNGQLIESLEELAAREDEIKELTSQLQNVQGKLKDIAAKETLLYREHIAMKKSMDQDLKHLNKKLEASELEREKMAVKAARLDQLVAVLEVEDGEGDPFAKLRDTIRELTRQVAKYEVNQSIMSRKHNLLKEENKGLQSRYQVINKDFIESNRTLKLRILYLELWRKGAQAAMEENQRLMDNMVPRDIHEKYKRKLQSLQDRYKELLVKEAEVRTIRAAERDLPRKIQDYEYKYKNTVEELKKMEALRDLAEERASSCLKLLDERQKVGQRSDQQDIPTLLSNIDSLTFLVAEQKGKYATANVLLMSEKAKNKTLNGHIDQYKKSVKSLKDKCDHLNNEVHRAQEKRNEAEDMLREFQDEWEGGCKKEEFAAKNDYIAAQEALYEGLKREAQKGRDMAEIAMQQVASSNLIKEEAKKELAILKESLRELGSQNDDNSIIGKLTLENVNLKVKIQRMESRYDLTRAELSRVKLEAQKLEHQLDTKDAKLRDTRKKARAHILGAERALERLRDDLNPASGTATGLFERLEQMNDQIRELSESGEENEKRLRDAEKAKMKLETSMMEKDVDIKHLSDQLNDLKALLQRSKGSGEIVDDEQFPLSDAGSSEITPLSSNSKDIARRLLKLSDELKQKELLALRQKRELEVLRSENKHLQKRDRKNIEAMRNLEDALVNAQTLARQRELEAFREKELNNEETNSLGLATSLVEGELDGKSSKISSSNIFAIASTSPGSSEHTKGESGKGSNANFTKTIERLEEFQRVNVVQTRRINELEAKLRAADAKYSDVQDKLQEFRSKAGLYSKQLRAEGLPVLDGDDAPLGTTPLGRRNKTPSGSRTMPATPGTEAARAQFHARETQKLTEAAKQTISQLRSMLEKKTKLVNEYKHRMDEQATRYMAEKQRDQEEIRRLTDKVYDDNNANIEKLREAFEKLESSSGDSGARAGGVNLTLMEAMDGLTDAVAKKDSRIQTLEGEIAAKTHQVRLAEQRAGQALGELDELRHRAALLQRAVDSRATKKLVSQLKRQLKDKEKKMAGLREAIVRLKEEFVKAEEEREVEKIEMEKKMVAEVPENKGNTGGRSSSGANNDETIRQMNNKVRSLMDRMEHNKKQLDAANRKTKKMEESRSAMKKQNESLRDQVEEQADTIQAQIDAISDLKDDLKEAKRTIDRLREQAIKLRQTSSSKNVSGTSGTSSFNETIQKKNEERIKVLEAQVKAYKSELARMEATATKKTAKTSRVESKVSGVQSAPSRAAWEAQKRLRKRADTLSSRLHEKREELEVAIKTAEKAKAQLARCQQEKSVLESKIAKSTRSGESSKSLTAALSDLESSEEIRKKVFALERKCSEYKRVAEVEKEGKIRQLQATCDSLKNKVKNLTDDLTASKRRVRQLERSVGGSREGKEGDASYLRSSVERFEQEEAARDELDLLRGEYRELEARLIERDNLVLELRFDVETAQAEQSGYARRIRELEASNKALSTQILHGKSDSSGSMRKSRQAGDRFRRERDLEGVIDSQNRVIMKLQAENERLARRGVSTAKLQEARKEVKDLKARIKSLDDEREKLLQRAASASDARMGFARLKEQAVQLRKQVKSQNESIKDLKNEISDLRTGKSRLQNELEQANKQLYRSRNQRAEPDGISDGKLTRENEKITQKLRVAESKLSELEKDLDDAKSQIKRRERDLERLSRSAPTPGKKRSRDVSDARLAEDNEQLREENRKLKDELSAFDMEFFEEIEDLKYNYQQVTEENQRLRERVRRLRDE